jgi:Rad3-related DNA helicase
LSRNTFEKKAFWLTFTEFEFIAGTFQCLTMSDRVQFPRDPYPGQRKLGESIFSACEDGSTAIFESPTGTGKSLAVLCGALSYLKTQEFDALKVDERIQALRKEYESKSVFTRMFSYSFLGISTDKSLANEEKFKQMHVLRCQLDDLEDQQHRQRQIERHLNESADEALRKERHQVCKLFLNMLIIAFLVCN